MECKIAALFSNFHWVYAWIVGYEAVDRVPSNGEYIIRSLTSSC